MAVKVFKSTDTGAPIMMGRPGALTELLDACLVNGYGATPATATITITNYSTGETITIGSTTYTIRSSVTSAYDTLAGATLADTLKNIADAINGTSGNGSGGGAGSEYGTGTVPHPDVYVSAVTGTTITIKAKLGGTAGNSIATTETMTNGSWGGSTMSGGSGSNTITSAGWTKPYSGSYGQAVYKPGSGVQHYFHVDDNIPGGLTSKEAQFRGSEGATGFQAATNYFPTTTQIALGSGITIRKSTTSDATNRSWIVVADDRTCYIFVLTGDAANIYYSAMFGEFYSTYNGTDLYRSLVIGRNAANSSLTTNERLADISTQSTAVQGSHYVPRSYTATGGSLNVTKWGDAARAALGNNPSEMGQSGLAVPSGPDGYLHIAPVHVSEISGPHVRGRMRGFYHLCHPASAFADGDTINGAGPYSGRTFLVIKGATGIQGNTGVYCMEITGPWETN